MQGQGLAGPGDQFDFRTNFNLMGFAAKCHATCFTVFLRKRFGAEALGFNGLFAFILMLLVAGTGNTGLVFFLMWLLFLAIHRSASLLGQWRGEVLHSQYAGDCTVARLFCRDDRYGKRFVEPVLCLIAGLLLSELDQVVASFVMCGSISLAMVQAIEWRVQRVRLQAMKDAEIEQRHYAAIYRNQRGM